MSISTAMLLPTTLQSMLLSFIHPMKSCLEEKAILPVELSYNEEGENLLNDYENENAQQDSVSKYM